MYFLPGREHLASDQFTKSRVTEIGEEILIDHRCLDMLDCLFESGDCLLGRRDDVPCDRLRDIVIESCEEHIRESRIIISLLSRNNIGEEGDEIGMRENRDWIFSHGTIPPITRGKPMDDEEIAFEVILICRIEVDIREEWGKERILGSMPHILHDLRISIRIDERIVIDLIVGCPEFREGDQIVFLGLYSYLSNI